MSRRKGILFTAALAAFFLFSFPGLGLPQEQEKKEEQEVTDEELMELLGMTVEAASKKEESVMTAPGIVSVLTANEIRELGVHSVAEAVGYMAGIYSFQTYAANYSNFAIRGNFNDYTNKILLLINSHPTYVPTTGGYEINAIPIEAVERIELIRGPVSVMYGTNAMTGVINIVTKKEPTFLNGELRYQYGSFGTHNLRLSLGKNYEDSRYFVSANYQKQDGYDQVVKPEQDEMGLGWTKKLYNDMSNLFFNASYKDLEIDVAYWNGEFQAAYPLTPNSLFYGGYWDHKLLYTDIRYTHNIGANTKLHFKFRADSYTTGWVSDLNAKLAASDSDKYGAEVYADIKLNEKLDLLVGTLYDRYHTDLTTTLMSMKIGVDFSFFVDDIKFSDTAAYANFNYQAAEQVSFVGGIRYTDNNVSGDHSDYRLGTIFNLKKDLVLKVMYGTSYRSPNHNELYISGFPIIMGNSNLDFETLQGLDIGIVYSYENKLLFSAGYFWNKSDNYITLRPIMGVSTYVNLKGQEAQGVELDLKYRPSKAFSFFFNSSNILSAKDLELDTDLVAIIKNMLKFGFSYKPTDALTFTNSNLYRSDWDRSEAYFLSNLAVYYRLPGYQPGTELFVTVNNLFDTEYTYAEITRGILPSIPGGPPRSVTAGIILSF